MLNRPSKSVHGGFSMIELLIGVVILAILMSLAVPSFQAWIQNTQIRNAAEAVQNGLQRARAEAVGRNTNVDFILGTGSSWTVSVASSGEVIESRSASEGSRNVTVAVDVPGATTVRFNNFGGVAAAPAPFTRVDLDSSVLAAADSQELRVTLGVGGNVRMCDPNAPVGSPRAC